MSFHREELRKAVDFPLSIVHAYRGGRDSAWRDEEGGSTTRCDYQTKKTSLVVLCSRWNRGEEGQSPCVPLAAPGSLFLHVRTPSREGGKLRTPFCGTKGCQRHRKPPPFPFRRRHVTAAHLRRRPFSFCSRGDPIVSQFRRP